ncbi:non-canonical purine NTP diphosphatase [Plebeiibacterium marinum]|uniref:dITP/XTP pyrophosphatase n=1 Tax=Plebeiibacterium marinum TaxID=2992111 RepID=A0AAE3MEG7_9BACT|nr:non-canonical purine NTP diphosphatase [Plebeiobacterium marinum]MCW3806433.1 non-canonical purine NTP diphosphatase [Plebeiobacterium marinum]
MELLFATNNTHKFKELKNMLNKNITLKCLADINCTEEIPETGNTLESNASQKSFYIHNKYKINCFSDDTGLEIEALNDAPGVYSARYAGEEKDAEQNMLKVLDMMKKETNRKARFRTVISLILNDHEYQFEGIVEGKIEKEKSGNEGFGYDPIFTPDGYSQTFAEMNLEEKNKISHRGQAVKKLVDFLNKSIVNI